ncbi:hypothetical protein [Lysobacter sp. Hz 25]|uniref:hypothetical protein n=1 Tax=Lysobacter sp. Hz 25 TaxID=3383698 RepID=UPI0038D49CE5
MSIRLRPLRLAPLWLVACLFATAVSTDTQATEATPASGADRARIGADSGRAIDGRAAVNQTAGVGNVQTNLAAIAVATEGVAIASASAGQSTVDANDGLRDASAHIGAGAFADSHGLLSVNQSAGAGNAQANLFVLATGTASVGLDDTALATIAGETQANAGSETAPRQREAAIAGDAFRGGEGVLQINQTVGVGNSSANAIVLQLPGGF